MKIRHFLLGMVVVALMTACGGNKTTETATETAVQTVTEQVEQTVKQEVAAEQTIAETPASQPQKAISTVKVVVANETKQVADPCEAKVKAFEKYVDELSDASSKRSTGAEALKRFADLRAKGSSMESTIQDCTSNPEYKTRLTNAIMKEKKLRS